MPRQCFHSLPPVTRLISYTSYPDKQYADCHGNVALAVLYRPFGQQGQGSAPYMGAQLVSVNSQTQTKFLAPTCSSTFLSFLTRLLKTSKISKHLSFLTSHSPLLLPLASPRGLPPVARYHSRGYKSPPITCFLYTSRYTMVQWKGAGHRDIDVSTAYHTPQESQPRHPRLLRHRLCTSAITFMLALL